MAMGEVQVAKREGHKVPIGTGLTKDGKDTTDPGEIADGGVLLPFGGYKGSGIAMMVELLAGALVGDNFSYETAAISPGSVVSLPSLFKPVPKGTLCPSLLAT